MLEHPSAIRVQSLGFLACQKRTVGTDLHVRVAALVVDRHGHPVEFRYTDTVQVDSVQQLLYGAGFVTGFLGQVMFEPLLRSIATPVSVWMVQQTELTVLRPGLGCALLEVTPGSIGDWPKFGTHTLHPEDLDFVSDLYETAGQWSCLEVFSRLESVLEELEDERLVTVLHEPPVEAKPAEDESLELLVVESLAEVEVELITEAVAAPEPEAEADIESAIIEAARLDSADEQPAPVGPPETVQQQLERLLVYLVESDQLQPTHYGYQVSGSLMWIHRAHFFNLAEAVQGQLPLTMEIDRELLRRSAQGGVVEAYEVYKELYGKMAVVFKLDLRKFPALTPLVGAGVVRSAS